MPDSFGFNHEVHRGRTFHRCIECGEFPWGTWLSEKDRARHHAKHERERLQRQARERAANLRLARRTKRQIEKENA